MSCRMHRADNTVYFGARLEPRKRRKTPTNGRLSARRIAFRIVASEIENRRTSGRAEDRIKKATIGSY